MNSYLLIKLNQRKVRLPRTYYFACRLQDVFPVRQICRTSRVYYSQWIEKLSQFFSISCMLWSHFALVGKFYLFFTIHFNVTLYILISRYETIFFTLLVLMFLGLSLFPFPFLIYLFKCNWIGFQNLWKFNWWQDEPCDKLNGNKISNFYSTLMLIL